MPKQVVKAIFAKERVLTEDSDIARELYNQSRFGVVVESRVELSLIEAYYLMQKKRIVITDLRNKPLDDQNFLKKALRKENNFWTRFCVFKDLRNRGYIVKTALKFGADFRVYDRGVKPGEDHAKWLVYPVKESDSFSWYEFSAKNRVANSTKKRLLIGVVDAETDVTYWEIRWMRP
ncbi:tRNA-intron lyase [Candidatus Woesearchaeota archaeon]|jgi:tRNA-intron endonuclease, archaea type|nr:tRNA-intron lyase [Candidatus Woesearchaeota archaeon]